MPVQDVPWSTRFKLSLLAGGLTATLLALSGCATVDAQTTAYVGVEHPAPTLASEVVVLRTEPLRPHVRLGEVVIDASVEPAPPITQVEEKLREESAKLGGDAVVVVYDHIQIGGRLCQRSTVGSRRKNHRRSETQRDCDQSTGDVRSHFPADKTKPLPAYADRGFGI